MNQPTVAVTNRMNAPPGRTLVRLAYPASSTAPAVRQLGKSHPAVPARRFSNRTQFGSDQSAADEPAGAGTRAEEPVVEVVAVPRPRPAAPGVLTPFDANLTTA